MDLRSSSGRRAYWDCGKILIPVQVILTRAGYRCYWHVGSVEVTREVARMICQGEGIADEIST
jgi:hypothetical protein